MAVGVICGLLTDVFWGNTIGFYILLYTMIGYLNGTFERLFYDEDIKLPLVLISGSELIYGGIICFCGYILKGDFRNLSDSYYPARTCIHYFSNFDRISDHLTH